MREASPGSALAEPEREMTRYPAGPSFKSLPFEGLVDSSPGAIPMRDIGSPGRRPLGPSRSFKKQNVLRLIYG